MTDVTGRALQLLALLQARSVWSAADLSEELGVTPRSVRRDVDRLRTLGYPIEASPGHGGGYRLGAGKAIPPLLLSTEEATAVAVGLRLATVCGIDDLGQPALRALTTLDRVLPPQARGDVTAISEVLDVSASRRSAVASPVLVLLARAVRDQHQLRVDYERRDGFRSTRRLEPYRVVSVDGRWYLFAHDLEREDWRTFRLDRMHDVRASTFRYRPRPTPENIEEYVRSSLASAPAGHQARVRFARPRSEVAPLIPEMVGSVEADGEDACILTIGSSDPRWTALHLAHLGLPIEVLEPPELQEEITALGAWFADRT